MEEQTDRDTQQPLDDCCMEDGIWVNGLSAICHHALARSTKLVHKGRLADEDAELFRILENYRKRRNEK